MNYIQLKVVALLNRGHSLRKHAYSNILKISPPKTASFPIKKKSDIFHIAAQNIDEAVLTSTHNLCF